MAPKGSEPTRKSARNVTDEAPKSWDEKQRERGRLARLAMLERDNHHTDNTHMMKVQNLADDEIVGGGDSKKRRKKASLAEKTRNRTLDQILSDSAQDMIAENGVSYHDIAMGKQVCSMCGFEGAYTCRITGARLCSKACYRNHESNKLKGLKR